MTEQSDVLSTWLYRLLTQRWMVILSLTVAGFLGTAVYALSRTPLYSSRALLRVGTVVHKGNLERPRVLSTRIETLIRQSKDSGGCAVQTSFVDPPESIVYVTVSCPDPDRAQRLVQEALEKTIERHKTFFDQTLATSSDYVASLKDVLARLTDATAAPDGTRNGSDVVAVWLARAVAHDLSRVVALEPGAYTYPTEVLQPAGAATAAQSRISVIGLGGLVGLILGVLFAMFLQALAAGKAAS